MIPQHAKRVWKLGREEFNTQFFDVTRDGELLVKEGNYQYNISDLARKYGSPLEIVFPFILEQRVRELIEQFNTYIKQQNYHGRFFYHYPMKVNQNREFVMPLLTEGANLETSSANELWLVKRLWEQEKFNDKIRVLCNGPKTSRYLSLVDELDRKGLIITPIIENEEEIAALKPYKGEVGVRVDLEVKVKSHWDKKFNQFGIPEAHLLKMPKIKNLGLLSYHISSQVERLEGITAPIKRAVSLYAKMREKHPQLDTVDIGGGLSVPYEKKRIYTSREAIRLVVTTFKQTCARLGVREPNIICEWGRYVAAPAQITVFKVLATKTVHERAKTKWYFIDGSFINDLSDTWAIKQKWQVVPVSKLDARKMERVWLAGSSCDSDDKYTAGGSYVPLPKKEDDEDLFVAVLDTGAYQDSLASHHCLLSSPAKLIIQNGDVKVARKRETPEEVGKLFGW